MSTVLHRGTSVRICERCLDCADTTHTIKESKFRYSKPVSAKIYDPDTASHFIFCIKAHAVTVRETCIKWKIWTKLIWTALQFVRFVQSVQRNWTGISSPFSSFLSLSPHLVSSSRRATTNQFANACSARALGCSSLHGAFTERTPAERVRRPVARETPRQQSVQSYNAASSL